MVKRKEDETKPAVVLNIHQKLIAIRKAAPYLKQDTKGYNYTYASGTTVLGHLKSKMDELSVLLVPSIIEFEARLMPIKEKGTITEKPTVVCKMLMTWIDADNPKDSLEVPWSCFGTQDDISKAFGSALTYAERYFLLKFFNIPTDKDDPDKFEKKYAQEDEGADWTEADEKKKAIADRKRLELEGTKPVNDATPKKEIAKLKGKAYLQGKIIRLGSHNFVISSSGKGDEPNAEYKVNLKDRSCTCPAGKHKKGCKHVDIARFIAIAEQKKATAYLDDKILQPLLEVPEDLTNALKELNENKEA